MRLCLLHPTGPPACHRATYWFIYHHFTFRFFLLHLRYPLHTAPSAAPAQTSTFSSPGTIYRDIPLPLPSLPRFHYRIPCAWVLRSCAPRLRSPRRAFTTALHTALTRYAAARHTHLPARCLYAHAGTWFYRAGCCLTPARAAPLRRHSPRATAAHYACAAPHISAVYFAAMPPSAVLLRSSAGWFLSPRLPTRTAHWVPACTAAAALPILVLLYMARCLPDLRTTLRTPHYLPYRAGAAACPTWPFHTATAAALPFCRSAYVCTCAALRRTCLAPYPTRALLPAAAPAFLHLSTHRTGYPCRAHCHCSSLPLFCATIPFHLPHCATWGDCLHTILHTTHCHHTVTPSSLQFVSLPLPADHPPPFPHLLDTHTAFVCHTGSHLYLPFTPFPLHTHIPLHTTPLHYLLPPATTATGSPPATTTGTPYTLTRLPTIRHRIRACTYFCRALCLPVYATRRLPALPVMPVCC